MQRYEKLRAEQMIYTIFAKKKPTFQIEVQFLESDEEGVPGHGEEDPRSVAEGHPPHGGAPRVDRQCKKTIKGDRRLPKIS